MGDASAKDVPVEGTPSLTSAGLVDNRVPAGAAAVRTVNRAPADSQSAPQYLRAVLSVVRTAGKHSSRLAVLPLVAALLLPASGLGDLGHVPQIIQMSSAFADDHCRSAEAVIEAIHRHYRFPLRIVWIRWERDKYVVRIESARGLLDVEVRTDCSISERK